jgi:hypothetical protein
VQSCVGCVRKSVDVNLKPGAAADSGSSCLQCTALELRGLFPREQALQLYGAPTTTVANRSPTKPAGTHMYQHHPTVLRSASGLASTASAAGLDMAPHASACTGTWPTPTPSPLGLGSSLGRIRTGTARSGDPRRAVQLLLNEVDDGVPVFLVRQRRDDKARVRREQHLPLLRNRAARDPTK